MAINAAGLNVDGIQNPNWKGGLLSKACETCGRQYSVKRVHGKSRFCSLACVGVSQRGLSRISQDARKVTSKKCEVCAKPFTIPSAHAHRQHCCSKECSFVRRSARSKGDSNPSWSGGLSRLPYPWNFREISQEVIARDGAACRNPICRGNDPRLTTHHINYDKQDCSPKNLICLCSACNSRANFNRPAWQLMYQMLNMYPLRFVAIQAKAKKDGGGWKVEEF